MGEVSRRGILGLLPGAGCAALLAAGSAHSAAPPPRLVELFVVGPFPLGDLYEEVTAGQDRSGGPEDIGADPDRGKLIAGLNECQLFLLDIRDVGDPKAPKFARQDEGFPLLTAGGKVAYEWKDKKKKFTARLVGLRATRDTVRRTKAGPIQVVLFEARLELKGANGLRNASCVTSMTRSVEYDLTGKRVKG